MTIFDILLAIKQKLHIIIIVTTLAIIISALFSVYVVTPQYKSEIKIIIRQNSGTDTTTYNDVLMAQKMTSTYCQIIQSSGTVAEAIKQEINTSLSASQISKAISASGSQDNLIISVAVVTNDPYLSANIANAIPSAAKDTLNRTMDVDRIESIDTAIRATSPENHVSRDIVLAAVIGFILSVGYIVAKEYFDYTVKSEQDVREKIGMNVLAMLPKSKKILSKKG